MLIYLNLLIITSFTVLFFTYYLSCSYPATHIRTHLVMFYCWHDVYQILFLHVTAYHYCNISFQSTWTSKSISQQITELLLFSADIRNRCPVKLTITLFIQKGKSLVISKSEFVHIWNENTYELDVNYHWKIPLKWITECIYKYQKWVIGSEHPY